MKDFEEIQWETQENWWEDVTDMMMEVEKIQKQNNTVALAQLHGHSKN